MMARGRPRCARAFHVVLHIAITGAMLGLFSFAWLVGQAPSVHAAGVPYCGKLADERAPTRPVIHLNHTEGPEGTDLTVTASGWHPGAPVALHFDARDPKTDELYTLVPDFARGIVAKDGTITLSSLDAPSFFCVDMSTPDYTDYRFDTSGGTTAYFVLASDRGEVSAPVAFRYLLEPTIAIGQSGSNAQEAKVGSTIAVSGTDWEAHEPITITLRSSIDSPDLIPNSAQVHTTTDAHGSFVASYPLDAQLRWNTNVYVAVEGTGPRFGTLHVYGEIFLLPAVQPTFRVDRTLVTPGMMLTVSGENWYPGDTFTIKYCNAHWQDSAWVNGPNCGKEANPALGTVTVATDGRIHQQFSVPDDGPPRMILVRVSELAGFIAIQPIPVQIVDHLPTWDDIHPRVAALRNRLVASLPFTIPAALLLGALAFLAIRRWRAGRAGSRP